MVNYFADHAYDDISGFPDIEGLSTADLMILLKRGMNSALRRHDQSSKIWINFQTCSSFDSKNDGV